MRSQGIVIKNVIANKMRIRFVFIMIFVLILVYMSTTPFVKPRLLITHSKPFQILGLSNLTNLTHFVNMLIGTSKTGSFKGYLYFFFFLFSFFFFFFFCCFLLFFLLFFFVVFVVPGLIVIIKE